MSKRLWVCKTASGLEEENILFLQSNLHYFSATLNSYEQKGGCYKEAMNAMITDCENILTDEDKRAEC
jgi:hypothetical protein